MSHPKLLAMAAESHKKLKMKWRDEDFMRMKGPPVYAKASTRLVPSLSRRSMSEGGDPSRTRHEGSLCGEKKFVVLGSGTKPMQMKKRCRSGLVLPPSLSAKADAVDKARSF